MGTQEFLATVKSSIKHSDANAQVILFGSRARGTARNDSDWDFLILTNSPVNGQYKKMIEDNLFQLELESEQAISVIIHSKEYWEQLKVTPLYQNIAKDGTII